MKTNIKYLNLFLIVFLTGLSPKLLGMSSEEKKAIDSATRASLDTLEIDQLRRAIRESRLSTDIERARRESLPYGSISSMSPVDRKREQDSMFMAIREAHRNDPKQADEEIRQIMLQSGREYKERQRQFQQQQEEDSAIIESIKALSLTDQPKKSEEKKKQEEKRSSDIAIFDNPVLNTTSKLDLNSIDIFSQSSFRELINERKRSGKDLVLLQAEQESSNPENRYLYYTIEDFDNLFKSINDSMESSGEPIKPFHPSTKKPILRITGIFVYNRSKNKFEYFQHKEFEEMIKFANDWLKKINEINISQQ